MGVKNRVAEVIPDSVLPTVERAYDSVLKSIGVRKTNAEIEAALAAQFFESPAEYRGFVEELSEPPVSNWISAAESALDQELGEPLGNYEACKRYYAIVRKLSPESIIETGVRHGQSTLFILAALKMNGRGSLLSIDYPLRGDEASEELLYRDPNAFIPAGKDPGWLIPDGLLNGWTLVEGPSQQTLVDVLAERDHLDIFIHDSDHSLNCMLFEYEAAWPRLRGGGVLISDDVHENRAWANFIESKYMESEGSITNNASYAIKRPS